MSTAYGWAAGLLGMPPAQAIWLPRAVTATITPASVATITAVEQTFTVTGATTKDAVFVTPPGHTVGVTIGACRVTAANTVAVCWVNPTAGSLTPPAGDYKFTLVRALP